MNGLRTLKLVVDNNEIPARYQRRNFPGLYAVTLRDIVQAHDAAASRSHAAPNDRVQVLAERVEASQLLADRVEAKLQKLVHMSQAQDIVIAQILKLLREAKAFDQDVVSRGWLASRLDLVPGFVARALNALAAGNSCLRWGDGDFYSLPRTIRAVQGGLPDVSSAVPIHDVVNDKPVGSWSTARGLALGNEAEVLPEELHSLCLVELSGSFGHPKVGRELVRFRLRPTQVQDVRDVLARGLAYKQGIVWEGKLVDARMRKSRGERLEKVAEARGCTKGEVWDEAFAMLVNAERRKRLSNPPTSYDDLDALVGFEVGVFDANLLDDGDVRLGKFRHKEPVGEVWERTVRSLRAGEAAVWRGAGAGLHCVFRGKRGAMETSLTGCAGLETVRTILRVLRRLPDHDVVTSPIEHAVTCIREVAAEFDCELPDDEAVAGALGVLHERSCGVFERDGLLHVDPKRLDYVFRRIVPHPTAGEDRFPSSSKPLTPEQVLELVRRRGPATVKRLAACVGVEYGALEPVVTDLVQAGAVCSEKRGPWTRFFVVNGPDPMELLTADVLAALGSRIEPVRPVHLASRIQWDLKRVDRLLTDLWHRKIVARGNAVENGRSYIGYRLVDVDPLTRRPCTRRPEQRSHPGT